jgi:hypothetical protein
MVGTRHILGLAIDDAGVVATELSIQSGRTGMRRTGELLWEQDLTADTAKELGQRLRQFLREHGFSSKRAIVGLAAKWVLTKEIETPPAIVETVAGLLNIQAERAFSLNADELIFDYCGKTSASEKSQVLLLAARRRMVEQIRELTQAAGLHVQAVTVSALACSRALSESGPAYGYGLYTRPTYCEFWGQLDGSPRFLKHVPMGKNGTPAGYADQLASTLERLVLLSSGPGQAPPYRITAYDACGLPDELIAGLGQRLKPQIVMSNGRAGPSFKGLGLVDHPESSRAVAAAAVAMTGVGTDRPPVDFLNPRIGVKKVASRKRLITWAASIAGACVLGLGVMLADWHADAKEIATHTEWLKQNNGAIAAAQEMVDRDSYARSWLARQPQFLECVKALTEAFPDEGYIWLTSVALSEQVDKREAAKKENNKGTLIGKTTSEASFYEVLDQINGNQMFSKVEMIHLRNVGRDSREKEFAVNIEFQGAK